VKQILPLLSCAIIIAFTYSASARDQIRVVGSSTVFPFIAASAERFGSKEEFSTPIVESTGTGGGIKLFCGGIGDEHPDMVNASRPIKDTESAMCKQNGVTEITELPIGYDGIVIANAKQSPVYPLTKQHLFLALAREVPKDGKLAPNSYTRWKEIDPALPDTSISVYGPPPTSGTRDAFVEMVMEETCGSFPEFAKAYPNKDIMKKKCALMREDGVFVEAGENDNLIVQKLSSNKDALGIFGFSFLEQNASMVKANPIGGVQPDVDTIAQGQYGIARSLFVYVKNQHKDTVPGLHAFAKEFTGDVAVGEDGYLILKGLIPLPEETHTNVKEIAEKLEPMR
jgi:phosphate transport system substrate-binding protein